MGHVVGPLTTNTRMRLGDVAQVIEYGSAVSHYIYIHRVTIECIDFRIQLSLLQILQQTVQRATNKPFEVLIGKGDMMIKSHQMSGFGSCRYELSYV